MIALGFMLVIIAAAVVLDVPGTITGDAVGGAGLYAQMHSYDVVLEFFLLIALIAGICYLEISVIKAE